MFFIKELSLRGRIEESSLVDFLVTVLGVRNDLIGSEIDFLEKFGTSSELKVGISVHWAKKGFQTLLRWYQVSEISDIAFFQIAEKASLLFQTDIAIGNFVDAPEGSFDHFIVLTADGNFYKAYAISNSHHSIEESTRIAY